MASASTFSVSGDKLDGFPIFNAELSYHGPRCLFFFGFWSWSFPDLNELSAAVESAQTDPFHGSVRQPKSTLNFPQPWHFPGLFRHVLCFSDPFRVDQVMVCLQSKFRQALLDLSIFRLFF